MAIDERVAAARVLIAGAGLAGSALAMHLAEAGAAGVVVVDPDLGGELSSSARNAGGVRATWWQEVNVRLCARTIDRIADLGAEVGFRPEGYTWLYDAPTLAQARAHLPMQNRLGRDIELLTPAEVARRVPFLDGLDGVAGATFSPRDGLVNPDALRESYRRRARAAGAAFADGHALLGRTGDDAGGVGVRVGRLGPGQGAAAVLAGAAPAGGAGRCRPAQVVNAAGPWARPAAAALGYDSPAHPAAREIAVYRTTAPLRGLGMLVDTSGVYTHHESGDVAIAGWSPPADDASTDLAPEGRAFFEREVWPRLAARSSVMDRLEYVRSWRGLYELTPDRSAIAGAVPGRPGLFEIHSFSGRGVMQSDALAELVARLMVTGRADPDLALLSAARFAAGRALPEALHI